MTPLNHAEAIGDVIFARLSLNTVAQGAETDIGVSVFRGKRGIQPSEMPCITMIEAQDKPHDQSPKSTNVEITQHYVLQAYLACDPQHPNVAGHAALRDLKRCIFSTDGKPDSRLGDAVLQVLYVGRDIAARADGTGFVTVGLEISVKYAELLSNP